MEMHEIRYFLTVCKTRNFTRAAELCNVTQPALTRAIQKIEDELGGQLFSRERSNTHLTDLGRLLEPHFAEMLNRASEAKAAASRFLRLEGAELKLGVMCTIGPVRFVAFLNDFRRNHPGIELTLVEGLPSKLSQMLEAGELDLALMAQPQGFGDPLRALPLYEESFTIACSHGHAFAKKNSVAMAEMDGQIYLQRINCEYRDFLAEKLTEIGVDIKRSYRSEREDWIQTMVAAGMGVCFLPEFSATLPGLVTRPVTEPEVRREVCLVSVAGRRWSPPAAAIVNAMRQYPWPAGLAESHNGKASS
jgi:DNA-binding transcriptional LysR family regulator